MFHALVLDQRDGAIEAKVRELDVDDLPPGDTLIDVDYSSINYKDGLAVTGKGQIIRGSFPFVPGIDLAGTIRSSDDPELPPGRKVLVTGWRIGEMHWGGYSQKARVRSEWIVPLPDGLTTREAMILGTAGLTSMFAVMALESHGAQPGEGEVVVTGATGGVGSIAVALLAKRGFRVVASTGSREAEDFLRFLGAGRIIDRSELPAAAAKPLGSARWMGAIDTAGGATLAGILAQLSPHMSVAACGNASGSDLSTTVYPFILRGVNLLGIDSNMAPMAQRRVAWQRLATDLSKETLQRIEAGVAGLSELPSKCEEITEGRVDGRIVVDVNRI